MVAKLRFLMKKQFMPDKNFYKFSAWLSLARG
ncbi:hypothetical protein NSB1T_13760 [Coprobacter fastidiosus NSB1 = JCM 33896]|nr:hypothetical protein NSB1T_13760 [Coprobacter fastidiosus NSB1 = JCM 33896]